MSNPDELAAEEAFSAARAAKAAREQPVALPTGDPYANVPGRQPPPEPVPPSPPQKGILMPWSTDSEGKFGYDPNAGVIGMATQPFRYTHDVMSGKIPADVRNPAYIGGAFEAASTFGPGSAASRPGVGGVIRPTAEAAYDAAETGFRGYRGSGQMYPGDEYRTMLQNIRSDLSRAGLVDDPKSASREHRILQNEIDRVTNAPFVTSENLDNMRIALAGKNPANMQSREALMNYIEQHLPPGANNPMRDAIGNYRQAIHSDVITGKNDATSLLNEAKGLGPGLSAEQTRTNIAQLINSKKATQGFSDVEKDVMRGAVRPTLSERIAQRAADMKATPGGGGDITKALSVMAAPARMAAASYANRGARQATETADEFIRSLSPLARSQAATAPSNFRMATPGGYSVMSNPAIAKAVADRLREGPPDKNIPQQYKVLPDGTVEELL